MEVSHHTKYKISVHSNIASITIATVTEVINSFYQRITSFYVHYMVIQAQVVCELNLKKKKGNTQ